MSELYNEIRDDIRQERLDKLWKSIGKSLLIISAMVVAATAACVGVQSYRESRAMEKTTLMIQGVDKLNSGDFKGAITLFDELIDSAGNSFFTSDAASPPYYGLAMLRKAGAQAGLGQKEEAKKTYDMLASRDHVFGSLAQLLSYDLSPPSAIIAQPDKKSVLYYSQSEFRGWQLLQQGKKLEAVDQFAALKDDAGAPPSLRERMGEVVQYLAEQPDEKTHQENMHGK